MTLLGSNNGFGERPPTSSTPGTVTPSGRNSSRTGSGRPVAFLVVR
jgi:hypothetical protein